MINAVHNEINIVIQGGGVPGMQPDFSAASRCSESLQMIYDAYFATLNIQKSGSNAYMLAPSAGEGGFHRLRTFSGLQICYSDYQYHRRFTNRFQSKESMVEIQFNFSGERHIHISGKDRTLDRGTSALLLMEDIDVRFTLPNQERHQSFSLGVPVSLFNFAVAQAAGREENHFRKLLDVSEFQKIHLSFGSPEQELVKRLIHDVCQPMRSMLLVEGTAYELLDRMIQQLFGHESLPEGLSAADVRKLSLAHGILESRYASPPSLLELAKEIGLNDYKLKLGFKQCYGTTVFGFIRKVRMERAMELLHNGEANVTEAALTVGYRNVSAFSQTFRQTYGVSPSEVKKYY